MSSYERHKFLTEVGFKQHLDDEHYPPRLSFDMYAVKDEDQMLKAKFIWKSILEEYFDGWIQEFSMRETQEAQGCLGLIRFDWRDL